VAEEICLVFAGPGHAARIAVRGAVGARGSLCAGQKARSMLAGGCTPAE